MSAFERLYALGAGVILACYAIFVVVMTQGGALAAHSPKQLAIFVVVYLLVLAALMSFLWARTMMADPNGRTTADERENQIEARAERGGYFALDIGLMVLLVLVLGDAILTSADGSGFLGSFRLNRPEAIVFAVASVSTIGALGRCLVGWISARRL